MKPLLKKAYSAFQALTGLLIVGIIIVGFTYLFGLGVWAAAGKLHILARDKRLSDGLIAGAVVVGFTLYTWKASIDEAKDKETSLRTAATRDVQSALRAGYELGCNATYLYRDACRSSGLHLDSLDHGARELLRENYPGLIEHLPEHEREKIEKARRKIQREAEARSIT